MATTTFCCHNATAAADNSMTAQQQCCGRRRRCVSAQMAVQRIGKIPERIHFANQFAVVVEHQTDTMALLRDDGRLYDLGAGGRRAGITTGQRRCDAFLSIHLNGLRLTDLLRDDGTLRVRCRCIDGRPNVRRLSDNRIVAIGGGGVVEVDGCGDDVG